MYIYVYYMYICVYLWLHNNAILVCLTIFPLIETHSIESCVCERTLSKGSKFNAVMMCPILREY